MYLHFKTITKQWLLISVLLMPFITKGQEPVVVTAMVSPPFSTNFSYYIDNPNKIQVTFLNTSGQPLDVYAQGRLTGDNGVEIKSDPSWHPAMPITLFPGVPFHLTQENIGDVFSSDHIIYTGTSQENLINLGGLPEGNYQFCFSVYDFNTGAILSNEDMGCSNIIIISYIDPPVILNPICSDSITATIPQNILVSWTTPIGAGPNIKYKFIMTEMHPGDRNPNDALAAAAPPYFMEKDLPFPQLLIGPGDPPLVEGRSYAFYVQAYDPDNLVIFNNNGISEACWFNYKEPLTIVTGDSIIELYDFDDFTNDFELIPNTSISGQLKYKLASETNQNGGSSFGNSGSSGNGLPGGSINFINLTNNGGNGNANTGFTGLGGISGINFTSPPGSSFSMLPPFGTGNLFGDIYSPGGAEPLRNTTIRLVARFSLKQSDGFFLTRHLGDGLKGNGIDLNGYTFYDLNGNEVSAEKILSVVDLVLDVCTTNDQGDFTFDFTTDFFTGPVYAVSSGNNFGNNNFAGLISLRIEVENQKFCSPDIHLFAKPGDVLTTPAQMALIKDYNLHLTVESAYDIYNHATKIDDEGNPYFSNFDTIQKAIPGGEPIPNAIVRVLRNAQKLDNEHPAILLSEGTQPGNIIQNDYGEFKEVFYGKSDNEGKIIIPHLVEHWAITDGEDQSPYFFYVRTREENIDSAYSNTLYNYEPFFGTIKGLRINVDAGGPTELDDDAGFNGDQPVTYNHYYSPPASATDREVRLNAAKPEIQGRLMAKTNLENIPIKDALVNLYEQWCKDCNSGFYDRGAYFSNDAGFFRIKNLSVNIKNGYTAGPYRRINFTHSLYKSFIWPPQDQPALNLKYGELYFKEFQLEPRKKLRGKVVDEEGNPVAAYVKLLPHYPYVKTEKRWEYDNNGNIYLSGEVFESVAFDNNSHFEVQPLSNNYFADTITVESYTPGYMKTFTVYRKMHRLKLRLFDIVSQGVIANATVVVGDTLAIGQTNQAGIVELVFPSPGEQFLVRVSAENYTPTQASFNIPVSKTWHNETMKLHYALHIEGTVTETASGLPIDSAMVYTQLQNTDGHTLFIKAYSDANGHYRLNGLPWYDTPTDIEIHAVKDSKNPSYIGDTKTITVKSSMMLSGYDFRIKAVEGWDLTNIWGFPITVEKMNSRVQFGTRISGYFHNMPHVPDLNTVNQDEKVYFKNLKITKGPNGAIIPVNDAVITENYTLPIKIDGGFEGKLSVVNSYDNGPFLKVLKNGNYGKMSGSLKIDLSSFKFTYDFSGNLYLGNDTTQPEIIVFRSINSGLPGLYNNKHFLFDYERLVTLSYPKPITDFRVFGFNASSNFKGSYIQNGTIHIATVLHTDIPMPAGRPSLDLKINAGEIQITKENMDLVHDANSQLSFDLEEWKVVSSNGWTFDKTRDAIVIPKGTIFTGLGVDAGIKGLNIRPNALREGEIDFDKGLSLGGIATLNLVNGMKPVFNYDAGVGHYRISLVGNTSKDYVGWVENLPATPDKLEFTSIGMLSDNSTVLSLGKTMRFHNLMDLFVDQIMSGNGFFRLAGMPELGIPGYVASRSEVTYTKENGNLKFTLEPLAGGIDCNANTDFTLEQIRSSQSLTNKLYTSFGEFYIKPPPDKGGDMIKIKGFLTKTPSQCYIDVITPQSIKMGKEQFDLIEGKISVVNNAWNELNFTAHTHSKGIKNENVLAFAIHGGIDVNGDNITADSIETPLGNLTISYLFAEKALVGALTIDHPVMLGFGILNNGMMNTRFDPHGFYLGFSGNVTILSDNYDGGFLLGYYDADLNNVAQPMFAKFETNIPTFNNLKGFYVIGQRVVVDKTLPLLAIDVYIKGGYGAFVHLDFDQGLFSVGGYGFAHAVGGINIEPCGFVGVRQDGYAELIGKYQNKVLSISTCQSVSTCVNACGLNGCLDFTSKIYISTDKSDASIEIGGSCSQ